MFKSRYSSLLRCWRIVPCAAILLFPCFSATEIVNAQELDRLRIHVPGTLRAGTSHLSVIEPQHIPVGYRLIESRVLTTRTIGPARQALFLKYENSMEWIRVVEIPTEWTEGLIGEITDLDPTAFNHQGRLLDAMHEVTANTSNAWLFYDCIIPQSGRPFVHPAFRAFGQSNGMDFEILSNSFQRSGLQQLFPDVAFYSCTTPNTPSEVWVPLPYSVKQSKSRKLTDL